MCKYFGYPSTKYRSRSEPCVSKVNHIFPFPTPYTLLGLIVKRIIITQPGGVSQYLQNLIFHLWQNVWNSCIRVVFTHSMGPHNTIYMCFIMSLIMDHFPMDTFNAPPCLCLVDPLRLLITSPWMTSPPCLVGSIRSMYPTMLYFACPSQPACPERSSPLSPHLSGQARRDGGLKEWQINCAAYLCLSCHKC